MVGFGDTAAGLVRSGKSSQRHSHRGEDAGLDEVRGFGFNPGSLRMLSYVPPGLAEKAPLVVVLHGCGQRAGSHARAAGWLTLADRFGFAVLAPEQDGANNPNRCFNWFEPADTARGSGEAASIHAMIGHMVRAHRLDPERVFVTGLSAGGAMAAVLLATYPETFAGGAVVAGLPFGLARNMQEAFAVMRGTRPLEATELGARVLGAAPSRERAPRLSIWHGQADATVASSNAQALARQWASVHGLRDAPDEVLVRGRRSRSVWRAPNGESLIEMNLLDGLGHGTPLGATGDDPIGEAAPFMLEAGVSSALETARFWGLAPAETPEDAEAWKAAHARSEHAHGERHSRGLGASVMASVAGHVSEDVQKVIAKALASAGLMR